MKQGRKKESSECMVWKSDNKETAKCRRKKWRSIRGDSEEREKRGRQTEVEREGVTEREKEQKIDTV